MILDPEQYNGKRMVIAGGGDSALDWTIFLSDIVEELTLVHRSESFRGTPDSVNKVMELAESGKRNLAPRLENVELIHNGLYGMRCGGPPGCCGFY